MEKPLFHAKVNHAYNCERFRMKQKILDYVTAFAIGIVLAAFVFPSLYN